MFQKIFNYIYKKFNKNKKIMIGTKITLKKAPKGKNSSSNSNIDLKEKQVFTVYESYGLNSWVIVNNNGRDAGWVYEWEMDIAMTNKEQLEEKLQELNKEVEEVKTKLQWLEETGNNEFSEDEYKVYKTLKLMEDPSLNNVQKSKLIAELIKK